MIISIKSGAAGGSSRGLVHYLAHSKLDKTKEEVEKRDFFNEFENDLDVKMANQNLSLTGGKPDPQELLHLVIAPSIEEIASVGDDLKTQKEALSAIVRETVAQLEKEVKAQKLKWIAVAHFNTDNPHAHLAVQKEFINENGQVENLRITRQMLHYNSRQENGEKTLHKGALILAAEEKVLEIAAHRQKVIENNKKVEVEKPNEKSQIKDENQQEVSSYEAKIQNYGERRILAEEMLVAAEITRREKNIENLIEHGDRKRFKIKDEATDSTRHVSLFDIERKIEIISRRQAFNLYPQNAEKRAAALSQIAEKERAKQLPIINQLETIHRHVLGFENRHLIKAEEKHTRLHNQKLLIEKKCERLKTEMPLPLITPDEIQQLQTEAFREQNIEKILFLENIRNKNALELKQPTRRERDVREFLGMKTVAALKLEAAEKRLANFPNSKDFVKVKIGNSYWSHHSLEQHENQNASPIGFFEQLRANTLGFIFRADKKNSKQEKLDYPSLKNQISDALENLKNEQRQKLEKQREFNQTLNKILDGDTNPHKTKLQPAFSAFELAEVEDLAQSAGRFDIYEKSLNWQENFLLEKSGDGQNKLTIKNRSVSIQTERQKQLSETAEKIIGKFVSGRAAARSIIANSKVAEAQENIDRYNRSKMFIKHRINDTKTGAEREVSLRDVEPKKSYYLLDKILLQIFEPKEQKQERVLVRHAANNQEKELKLNLETCKIQLLHLENQKKELQTKYGSQIEIAPVFTPKEIATLDKRKYQTTDKLEAEQLSKIITEAEKRKRVERIQDLLNNASKGLETILPNISIEIEPNNSPGNQLNSIRQPNHESQEITNQNSAEKNIQPKSHQTKTIEPEKSILRDKGRNR